MLSKLQRKLIVGAIWGAMFLASQITAFCILVNTMDSISKAFLMSVLISTLVVFGQFLIYCSGELVKWCDRFINQKEEV